jgi:hypothetical protein
MKKRLMTSTLAASALLGLTQTTMAFPTHAALVGKGPFHFTGIISGAAINDPFGNTVRCVAGAQSQTDFNLPETRPYYRIVVKVDNAVYNTWQQTIPPGWPGLLINYNLEVGPLSPGTHFIEFAGTPVGVGPYLWIQPFNPSWYQSKFVTII